MDQEGTTPQSRVHTMVQSSTCSQPNGNLLLQRFPLFLLDYLPKGRHYWTVRRQCTFTSFSFDTTWCRHVSRTAAVIYAIDWSESPCPAGQKDSDWLLIIIFHLESPTEDLQFFLSFALFALPGDSTVHNHTQPRHPTIWIDSAFSHLRLYLGL